MYVGECVNERRGVNFHLSMRAIAGIHGSWRLIQPRLEKSEVNGSFGRRQIGFGSSCNIDICLHSHSLLGSLVFLYSPGVYAYTANESTANKISAASYKLVHTMKPFYAILPYLILF